LEEKTKDLATVEQTLENKNEHVSELQDTLHTIRSTWTSPEEAQSLRSELSAKQERVQSLQNKLADVQEKLQAPEKQVEDQMENAVQ
jgi:flagellin-like hook-associated protein FlgL